ncbi:MAG TPA: hypothetical protein VF609_00345 [Flavisolibacter sp.]|jgi:hypothetical protein
MGELIRRCSEAGKQEIYGRLGDYSRLFHACNQHVYLMVDNKAAAFFYFNYSFAPLHDANGEVDGVMNTA